MQALQIHAGPRALCHLRERGLKPSDVRLVPAAAGGPKGLVLNPLDRVIFGRWLAASTQPVHLVGASIGAWRMTCAALHEPERALERLAEDYIVQRYDTKAGAGPQAVQTSAIFRELLQQQSQQGDRQRAAVHKRRHQFARHHRAHRRYAHQIRFTEGNLRRFHRRHHIECVESHGRHRCR